MLTVCDHDDSHHGGKHVTKEVEERSNGNDDVQHGWDDLEQKDLWRERGSAIKP